MKQSIKYLNVYGTILVVFVILKNRVMNIAYNLSSVIKLMNVLTINVNL